MQLNLNLIKLWCRYTSLNVNLSLFELKAAAKPVWLKMHPVQITESVLRKQASENTLRGITSMAVVKTIFHPAPFLKIKNPLM